MLSVASADEQSFRAHRIGSDAFTFVDVQCQEVTGPRIAGATAAVEERVGFHRITVVLREHAQVGAAAGIPTFATARVKLARLRQISRQRFAAIVGMTEIATAASVSRVAGFAG